MKQSLCALINQNIKERGYQWTAGITSLSYLSDDEKRRLCGIQDNDTNYQDRVEKGNKIYQQYKIDNLQKEKLSKTASIPNWLSYMSCISSQEGCSDCWAHAAAGLTEGLLQYHLGYMPSDSGIQLDPTYIMNNASCSGGCSQGADLACGISYIYTNKCRGIQENRYPNFENTYYTVDSYTCNGPTSPALIQELLQSSPVLVDMAVFSDFYSYIGGIYHHTTGYVVGPHAVVILGCDDVNQCWICRNSWGSDWGESESGTPLNERGYFRIAYGECNIDYGGLYVTCSGR